MTRDEASAILELSPHATPAERAAQYDMLRRQLEDKLARAPTPGLREKYRTSLKQLEEAVAILSQTDDSAALPVLQKQAAASKEPATGGPAPVISTPSSRLHAPRPAGRKSGSREFALVAVIAIIVLAGGGWFVLKTRAENAEKARLAAAAKAEGEKIRLQLRTIVAEAKIAWEIAEREERDAERRTSELRSELRGLRDPKPEVSAELNLRLDSAQRYSGWLRDHLLRHPLKVARAKLEELLQAGAIQDTETAGAEVRRLTQALQTELAANPGGEAALQLAPNLPTARWEITGPLGFRQTGVGPQRVTGLFFTDYRVTYSHPTFDPTSQPATLVPGRVNQAEATFPFIRVTLKNILPGDRVEADHQPLSALPDGTYAVTSRKPVDWTLLRADHLPSGSLMNWSEQDRAFEFDPPVPIQARPLVDAALKILSNLSPKLRVNPLLALLSVSRTNRLMPAEERTRLLLDTLKAIKEEPLPESAEFAATEPRERLRASLALIDILQLADPEAAKTAFAEGMKVFLTLSDKDKVNLYIPPMLLASQREAMPEYIRLMQAALEADPSALKNQSGSNRATLLYGLLHLLDRGAEAEAWKSAVLARRAPSGSDNDADSFDYGKADLLRAQMELALRSALQREDYNEFNRLVRATSGELPPTTPLIDDLLDLGLVRQALDLAVSVNSSSYQSLFVQYALLNGRLALLEDYHSRVRAKNRTTELQLAEFLGLSGNSTKARLWVERAGDLSSFQEARLFTLAQLGDLTSARKIFDELEKASLKLAPSDRFVRLPRLVASARLLGEPARERRMLELAGMTDFKLEADWLMRIGDLDGALAQARASRPNFNRLIAFYGYFMLRHQATRELPWIYGGEDELPLILTHLIRLNRARQPAATLEVPYPRSTPATFRESINVTYPEAMVRSGLGGEARIIINVDDTGRATGYTTVTTPNPAFAEAMFKAAAEKGFHPALERGRPVAGTYEMTRNFRP